MADQGLNAKELSLKAGLNETAIRDILKGRSKSPRLDTTIKIAKALNIDKGWLIDGFGNSDLAADRGKKRIFAESGADIQEYSAPQPPRITFFDLTPAKSKHDPFQWQLSKAESPASEINIPVIKEGDPKYIIVPNNDWAPRFHYGDVLLFRKKTKPPERGDFVLLLDRETTSLAFFGPAQQETCEFWADNQGYFLTAIYLNT